MKALIPIYIMVGTDFIFKPYYLMCHCRKNNLMKILYTGVVRTKQMNRLGCECRFNFSSVVDPATEAYLPHRTV
jgi:hypothetical protein